MKPRVWWTTAWLSRGVLVILGLATVLTFWLGHLEKGVWAAATPTPTGITWFLFSSANTFCAVACVTLVSSSLGGTLAVKLQRRASGAVARGLELVTSLPVFVLGLLWLNANPGAPLAVLVTVVAVQRTLQVAVLIQRAAAARWPDAGDAGLYPVVALNHRRLRDHGKLLWVGAAHSTVLFFVDEAALTLVGFLVPSGATWISTLCLFARTGEVPAGQVITAGLAILVLPLALWNLGLEGEDRDSHPSRPLPLALDRRL